MMHNSLTTLFVFASAIILIAIASSCINAIPLKEQQEYVTFTVDLGSEDQGLFRRDLTKLTITYGSDCKQEDKDKYSKSLILAQEMLKLMQADVSKSPKSAAYTKAFGDHAVESDISSCLSKIAAVSAIKVNSCHSSKTNAGAYDTSAGAYEFGLLMTLPGDQAASDLSIPSPGATWIHELSHGLCGTKDTIDTGCEDKPQYHGADWAVKCSKPVSKQMAQVADAYRVYGQGLLGGDKTKRKNWLRHAKNRLQTLWRKLAASRY